MKVLIVILISYASAGLAQLALILAYRSPAAQQYMISDDPHRSVTDRELYYRVALNITVSQDRYGQEIRCPAFPEFSSLVHAYPGP